MTKKILITGSREWDETGLLILIHGDAPGADKMSSRMAQASNAITEVKVPADWQNLDRWVAGPRRNGHMLDLAPDVVLSFRKRGAGNRGTQNCMQQARDRGIPVKEYWNDDIIVTDKDTTQNDTEGTTVS